jgi:ribosomal protein L16 Arg81 hydroxylase
MLNKIIGPIGKNNFLEDYFEKKPLLQKQANVLTDIFSLADFDSYLIAGEGILQDLVRITFKGSPINIPAYSGQATTQREFVLDQFKSGATLKIEDLDSRHVEIAKLCKDLESAFGGYAFAKPFLTGAGFPGLSAHFDTTEVFVVQLEGRKTWKVWNKIVENPTLPMQQKLNEPDLGAAVIETILEPGDILYIPAGSPHSAKCLDEHSLRIAFGLQPIKIFEVLEGYLRLMSEHMPELRKNIYPFSVISNLNDIAKNIIERLVMVPFVTMKSAFDISYNSTKHETSDRRLITLA